MHHGTSRTCWLSTIATGSRRVGTGALCALIVGMAGSCSDGSTAVQDLSGPEVQGVVAGPATQMIKSAGDDQAVAPGTAVPVPPAVRVSDQSGNPVNGAHVLFTVAAGDGSVSGGEAVTGANGVATVGSWTLGTTKGQNVLTASVGDGLAVSFRANAAQYSPDVTPSIYRPEGGAVVGDSLEISTSVRSRYELASVQAAVGAKVVELTYSAQDDRWVGIVPLQGLPRDTLQLVVTARDVNGSTTDAFLLFVHDRKPTLTVFGPDSDIVARPSIDFSADCVDDDPAGCRSLVVQVRGDPLLATSQAHSLLATGQAHVSGTASLSDYDGQVVDVIFSATDSRGQEVQAVRTVYVESSTKLEEIVTVDGSPLDIRGDQVLYWSTDTLFMTTITSGATQAIYTDSVIKAVAWPPYYGFLTATGAIFAVGAPSPTFARVVEWRNGALLDLGELNSGLVVSGDYALFSDGPTLTRRDLTTGTNTTISTQAGNIQNGVAPNGDVAFWSSGDYRVYRYHDGTTTLLTPDDGTGQWNTGSVTDGVNVVFRRNTPCCTAQTFAIVLHNGTGETVLAPARSQNPSPGLDYAVNAGWTAFTMPGTGGVLQVWTRSPTGEIRQVSFFGKDSRISALGSDGTVIFWNLSLHRRYIVAPGGTARDLMSNLGTVFWRDGRFIAAIGHTVFAIAP